MELELTRHFVIITAEKQETWRKSDTRYWLSKTAKDSWRANNLELTSAQVKRIYPMRQQIEEVFRWLKQEFGWSKCRANSVQAQKAHLHLGLYAFCLTQTKAIEKKQTIYAYKQNLFRDQIPTQSQFLQRFSNFA